MNLDIISSILAKPLSNRIINLVAAIFSASLFGYLLLWEKIVQPDLWIHIRFSEELLAGKIVMGHPTFFLLLQLFSGFTCHPSLELFSAFMLFGASQFFKITLSIALLQQIFKLEKSLILVVFVLAIQLAIGASILNEHFIMATISPNYFHNGTLSLSIPFAIWLMIETLKYLENEDRQSIFKMILIGLIIISIKPSFLFCWIPIVPIHTLIKYGLGKKLLGILQVSVILVCIIIIQSLVLRNYSSEFKLVFHPFGFFGSISNHVLVILSGLLFPIVLLTTNIKRFIAEKTSILFVMMLGQALFLSFMFYDSVNGVISFNMNWQTSIIFYMIMLFCIGIFIQILYSKKYFLVSLSFLALLLQLVSGFQYLYWSVLIHSFFV